MTTERLYHTEAYTLKFAAQVAAQEQGGLVLNRTAFYPGGGGQPADQGFILWQSHRYPVTRIRRSTDEVLHWVETDDLHPLPPLGARVHGLLDWDRRFRLMRTHTALHVLCGVVWRDFGARVTGGNMEPLKARMDFELAHLSAGFAAEVEAKVNAEVNAAREVKVEIIPRAQAFQIPDLIRTKVNLLPSAITQVRVVEIVGLDIQADGGTHVANTREIGRIRVVKHESKGRINKRLRVALDDQSLA